ncbi:MAG: hypothetical protein F7B17_04230 [Desulfurococcales archaeon]|nr:hypothetical protein [Desulfurococcales archaeon]
MAESLCLGELRLQGPPSVADALEVDNKIAPPWLSVSCRWESGEVKCRVVVRECSSPRRILSLRNTLVDILLCYRAAMDSLRAAEPR